MIVIQRIYYVCLFYKVSQGYLAQQTYYQKRGGIEQIGRNLLKDHLFVFFRNDSSLPLTFAHK
ncbi:hypothetical protein HQ45_05400 [Porphyromonas crevioricanis]|uniref:Uncharacterized protein n=1 Tax=Porphyromonas crevioricanis JCM 15906 TaxID=1305617 RepID=T1CS16_9PORP|nr:hypothetical protein HQ45_05400 [Porphyromonas crevioricanis]GAD05898.1 hypothetical protein PORCRE_1608 [Porphyromonas crevioricanis JCM 15906]SKA03140.1 hypothetical protein SAMN02745203_01662 [Porphyromonas crevioricanis]